MYDGPWLGLILFKPSSAKIETYCSIHPPKNEAEAWETCAPRIIRTYAATLEGLQLNRLKSLSEKLEEIAKETHSNDPSDDGGLSERHSLIRHGMLAKFWISY